MSAHAAMTRLDDLATELNSCSVALVNVERDLEPVEKEFSEFVDTFELGLYHRSINEQDFKLPSEALRQKLAIRAMAPELYGRRTALANSSDRLRKRISDLKAQVDAQRSILSALKTEMEATR